MHGKRTPVQLTYKQWSTSAEETVATCVRMIYHMQQTKRGSCLRPSVTSWHVGSLPCVPSSVLARLAAQRTNGHLTSTLSYISVLD
jgi:hypothetical protein